MAAQGSHAATDVTGASTGAPSAAARTSKPQRWHKATDKALGHGVLRKESKVWLFSRPAPEHAGGTLLHVAAAAGDLEQTLSIIETGLDLEPRDLWGCEAAACLKLNRALRVRCCPLAARYALFVLT